MDMPEAPLPSAARHAPVAALATVSYRGLAEGDAGETAKLLDAAAGEGFFYLDVRDGSLGRVDDVFGFARAWFRQPAETKMGDAQASYTDG